MRFAIPIITKDRIKTQMIIPTKDSPDLLVLILKYDFFIYTSYCIFFLSFVKDMLRKISKQAYTLTELLIAVTISAIVLIIIFFFVTDSLIQLSETEKNSRFLTDFARFTSQFQSQSTTFPNASFLIDNTSS